MFWHEGRLFRQINESCADEYRRFLDSGLYGELVDAGLLVSHEAVPLRLPNAPPAFEVIQPAQIPFISYPYEWCFSQLKAAALLTLDVHKRALQRGFVLRDASAYNIQFIGSRPVFIDTLSFGSRDEGRPWPGYRQFCQHFLAPLALSASVHPRLAQLTRAELDGIPLDVARRLLPTRTLLRPGILMHVHLHGRAMSGTRRTNGALGATRRMTPTAMLALADSLERAVRGLSLPPASSPWSGYADACTYSSAAQESKRKIVAEWLELIARAIPIGTIWDLGANTGEYSLIAAAHARNVVSFDGDHAVVEQHFRACAERRDSRILPLLQDLANPSAGIGWHHSERLSLVARGPADALLALALIHHLALGNNVPFCKVASFFRDTSRWLLIEFVPKEDSQVQRMLATRGDIFPDYTQRQLEEQFGRYFRLVRSTVIPGTVRTLYLMERT